MRRLLLVFLAAVTIILPGCGKAKSEAPGKSAPTLPASTQAQHIVSNIISGDADFVFADLDDYNFTMMYEPRPDAKNKRAFGLNIPREYDSDWLGDSQFDSNFNIFEYKTKNVLARVRVNTPPPNLAEFFNTDDPEEIRDLMRPSFFPVKDVYDGLKKAVAEDFEYDLRVDRTGRAYGWDAFYLEFFDPDTNTYALRFYTSNDIFDETFYAFEYKADIPADDTELIELARSVLFSVHPMNN
jgi:hypothetical protein